MFRHKPVARSWFSLAFETLELIYHVAVRNLRRSHNNAMLGLLMSIMQSLMMLLIMFFMMVGWHICGKQNLSSETYRTTPEMFMAKTQAMVDKYTVRIEKD